MMPVLKLFPGHDLRGWATREGSPRGIRPRWLPTESEEGPCTFNYDQEVSSKGRQECSYVSS